jgi:hypothetical protein
MMNEFGAEPNSLVSGEMFAVLQLVHGAAVGALGLTGVGHVQVDLGVAVPDFHIGQRVGAIDATLMVQVFGEEFNNRLIHGIP